MSDRALVRVSDLVDVDAHRSRLTLSPGLAMWVCALEDGADLPENLPAPIVEEAKASERLLAHLMSPVPENVLRPWLGVIASHYIIAKRALAEKDAGAIWSNTIVLALDGMPAGVFTKANAGEVMARFDWLPTASQLIEVLMPDRDTLERRAIALRRVALPSDLSDRPT